MITTDEGLAQTIELIGNRYHALCAMRDQALPGNRQRFAIMAAGPLDSMRELEQETRDYIETMRPAFPELDEGETSGAEPLAAGKDLEAIRAERRIRTDSGLELTLEQFRRMYRVLCSLQADTLPKSRQWFAIMSEDPLDKMRELAQEVRDYIKTMRPSCPKLNEEETNGASPSVAGERTETPRLPEREPVAA